MSWFAVSFAPVPVTFLACEGKAVSHRHPLSGASTQGLLLLQDQGRERFFSAQNSPQLFTWSPGMEDLPAGIHLSLGTVLQQLSEQPHHHRVPQQPGMSPVTASASLLQQILCLAHSETYPWTGLTCQNFCW